MRFIQQFKTIAQQETFAERRQRMLPGAMYGLIIASSYAVVSAMVNKLSFPDLPIGFDWHNLFTTWFFFAVWLGVGGAFINWFTQTEEGLIISLLVMTLTALGAGALTLDGSLSTRFGKSMLLVFPVIAISLLMTILLRWLGVRHADIVEKEKTLSTRGVFILATLVLVIGGLTGFLLTRWDDPTFIGVSDIHGRLQTAIADPVKVNELFPVNDLPELASHLGNSYTLLGKPYGQLIGSVQVTANFKDGYQFTCVIVVIEPAMLPSLRACAEGDKVTLQ